jgi:hypothetical protein
MRESILWLSRDREKAIESYMRNYRTENQLVEKAQIENPGTSETLAAAAIHEEILKSIPAGIPTDLRAERDDDSHRQPHMEVADGIPMPIVNLSRWLFTIGPLLAFTLAQPLLTTLLLVIDMLPLLFGRRWSLPAAVGGVLFARRLPTAEREDRRIITFNRTLVVLLLAGAQIAFWFNLPVVGWFLTLMVASANGVALAGFCVGCFLYYNFKIYRFRLFGGAGWSVQRSVSGKQS